MFHITKDNHASLLKMKIQDIEANNKIILSDKKQLTRFFKEKLKDVE